MGTCFFDVDGGNWEKLDDGQKRRIILMPYFTIMIAKDPKGTITDPAHRHENKRRCLFRGKQM